MRATANKVYPDADHHDKTPSAQNATSVTENTPKDACQKAHVSQRRTGLRQSELLRTMQTSADKDGNMFTFKVHGRQVAYARKSLWCFPAESRVRLACVWIVEWPPF